jgi:hypothetical protein
MKFSRISIIAVLVFLLLALIFSATLATDESPDAALLWLNPANSTVPIGESTDIFIQLDDVTNVYGAELNIGFDPSILAVVDADAGEAGIQISEGTCPAPDFVLKNDANNTAGTIEYVLTQLNPTPPCDGGTVATIEFECLADGINSIAFTHSLISDPNGIVIFAPTQDATLTCSSNTDPNTPSNPSPAHNATDVSVTTDLSWQGDDPDPGDTVTYDVFFDTSNPPTSLLCDDIAATTCDPGTLTNNTTYHWQVVATDNHGASTPGPVWQFTTIEIEQNPLLYLPLLLK